MRALASLLRSDLPVVDGVRIAEIGAKHVDSFSDQWNRWAATQVDSKGYRCGYAGVANSYEIFLLKTGLRPEDLAGRIVLDAGCGTGRFSEVAASMGARIISVDLSEAVFRAAELGCSWPDALFVKADLQDLPVEDASVDACFSIGVLHHCADPSAAVREIARVLRPGGTFAGWVYARQATYGHPLRAKWRAWSTDPAHRTVLFRFAGEMPILRDACARQDWRTVSQAVDRWAAEIPVLAELYRSLGGAEFREIVGISGSLNDEECRLDSFDWMTPRYQWQYDSAGWTSVLQSCGFVGVGNLQFPVSWRCAR